MTILQSTKSCKKGLCLGAVLGIVLTIVIVMLIDQLTPDSNMIMIERSVILKKMFAENKIVPRLPEESDKEIIDILLHIHPNLLIDTVYQAPRARTVNR